MRRLHSGRMRYAIIDLETTGFSPISDRVVEAACVLVQDGAIVRTWSSLVNPERPIPDYASRVHGITDADVAGAPPFERVQRVLYSLCEGATVVAHNASFDLGFLPLLAPLPSLCTLQLARRRFPNAPNHKNQTLRAYLHVDDLLRSLLCHADHRCHAELVEAQPVEAHPVEARSIEPRALQPHRALGDALVTAGILLRCLQQLHGGQDGAPVLKSA
jgi:DNA polymerase III subunit epsilon